MTLTEIRNADGTLPAYAWPGGYPVLYLADDGETFCGDCANNDNGAECIISWEERDYTRGDGATDGWLIAAWQIHYEGPPEICVHCGAEIPSAHGNPEEDQ